MGLANLDVTQYRNITRFRPADDDLPRIKLMFSFGIAIDDEFFRTIRGRVRTQSVLPIEAEQVVLWKCWEEQTLQCQPTTSASADEKLAWLKIADLAHG